MVPTTRGSELTRRLREVFKRIGGPKGTSVKVVEIPGEPILREIAPNNPFRMESCGRHGCSLSSRGRPCRGRCYRENVVYSSECKEYDPTMKSKVPSPSAFYL